MNRQRKYRGIRWVRRGSQGLFLLLFFYLILQTSISALDTPEALPQISAPVGFFLEIDPLAALFSIITTTELYRNLLWALAVVIGTVFIGRFFCGWICPMGTINHMLSSIRYGRTKGKSRLDDNRYRPYQRWKYGILAVFFGAALLGSLQIGLLDPMVFLTRAVALVILPAFHLLTQDFTVWSTAGDFGSATLVMQFLGNVSGSLLVRSRPVFFQSALFIGVLFFAVLLANRIITRFWCRGLCPLGALLGVLSRFSIFGMEKRQSLCTDCNLCALNCQGGDDPQPGYTWRQAECHLCFNCVADCAESGIDFRFFPELEDTRQSADIRRRTVLTTMAAGLVSIPVMRAQTGLEKGSDPSLVRPPGSVEEKDFLARCIRCGECMNVCPNNALHPTFLQAGLEGIWSPMLVPRIGYCEPTCVLCGQACPTGAIDEITEMEKGWVPIRGREMAEDPPLRIGTAFYDYGRCLPWAMDIECIVCEEWCPTSPKAIYFKEEEVATRSGEWKLLKRPYVDPQRCTGCGACTFACPVKSEPAIYITSAGETRSPRNSMLLKPAAPKYKSQENQMPRSAP